jgi:hypothetical protein
MKGLNPKVGDVVAFNELPDATWFDVLEINGFVMTIREHGTTYVEQRMDKAFVKQIRPVTK